MASVEQAILDRFEERVGTGAGKPDRLETHRFPFRPMPASGPPVAVIYPIAGTKPRRMDLDGMVQRVMRVRVRLHLGGEADRPERDGLPPDTIVDELYVWTVQRVLEAGAFGSLVDDLEESDSVWDSDETSEITVGARFVDFEVTFFTSDTDPETVV